MMSYMITDTNPLSKDKAFTESTTWNVRIAQPSPDTGSVRVSMAETIRRARLLMVDDEPVNISMLTDMLDSAGYTQMKSTSDPQSVLSLYREFAPDIILLDLMMPGMDGLAVMDQLAREYGGHIGVPVLVLTADVTARTKRLALGRGARDFLTKPFDLVELLLRIENLLESRFLHLYLQQQNELLEKRVQERTAELERAQQRIAGYAAELEAAHIETLERLARVVEFRDDDTGQHTHRVGRIAAMIAGRLGFPTDRLLWIEQAARLHDIGKVAISDLTLLKPGKLTEEEFAVMKTHAAIGANLFEGGRSELIQMAHRIAASHHEHWNGTGYPKGLAGKAIPIEARIIAVADVFDALTHDRPYKKAWPLPDAVEEIKQHRGQKFDPDIVDIFLELPHDTLI